jgi:hypothetical protein
MLRLIAVFSLLIVFGTSCTREFICQCKVKYTGNVPGLPDSVINEYIVKDTKGGAIKKCEANSSTITDASGINLVEECKLY